MLVGQLSTRLDDVYKDIPIEVASRDGLEHHDPGIFFDLLLQVVSRHAQALNLYKAWRIMSLQKKAGKKPNIKKIIWKMGRDSQHYSSPFVDWFSKLNHASKVYAAGCKSLDIFYNFQEKYAPQLGNSVSDKLTQWWIGGMRNRQAVANRKKIVVSKLVRQLNLYTGVQPVKIVSLASGSAEAVVEAVLKYGKPVDVKLLDFSDEAISISKETVEKAGLSNQFEFIKTRINNRVIEKHCKESRPWIIEMVGLMDYFKDDWIVKVIRSIKKCLSPGGVFFTCNINYNSEKAFLDWVLLWPMVYRTPNEWRRVIGGAWFGKIREKNVKITYDPFWVHGIAECHKT